MPVVEAKENVETFLGTGSVIESDKPFDTSGVGGSVVVRRDPSLTRTGKIMVHTTADYRSGAEHFGNTRGWQVALTKDQALCLARELVKMARDL